MAGESHNLSVNRPRTLRFVLVTLGLALGGALACGSSEGETTVNDIAFPEVQQRIIAAMFPPSSVMHTREFLPPPAAGRPPSPPRDFWRSIDTNEARVEGGIPSSLVIYRDGRRYGISDDGLLTVSDTTSGLPHSELLGSAGTIVFTNASGVRMKNVRLDGIDAIRIRLPQICDDGPCNAAHLYVSSEGYLPIRFGDGEAAVRFEHESIARSALPDDFFSIAELTSVADGIPSPPESWRQLGHTAYWLGPEFGGLVPRAATPTDAGTSTDFFSIGYGPPGAAEPISECGISIIHRSDLVPPLPGPVENLGTIPAQVGDVTIYRHEDQWAAWHGLADGGTLVASILCADPSSAPLRSLEGMTLVAQGLRPYDGPTRMADFAALSRAVP